MANASILEAAHCRDCNWPIVSVLCNDGMSKELPFKDNDYWMYCSNKTCHNHDGAASNPGDEPEFVIR